MGPCNCEAAICGDVHLSDCPAAPPQDSILEAVMVERLVDDFIKHPAESMQRMIAQVGLDAVRDVFTIFYTGYPELVVRQLRERLARAADARAPER